MSNLSHTHLTHKFSDSDITFHVWTPSTKENVCIAFRQTDGPAVYLTLEMTLLQFRELVLELGVALAQDPPYEVTCN